MKHHLRFLLSPTTTTLARRPDTILDLAGRPSAPLLRRPSTPSAPHCTRSTPSPPSFSATSSQLRRSILAAYRPHHRPARHQRRSPGRIARQPASNRPSTRASAKPYIAAGRLASSTTRARPRAAPPGLPHPRLRLASPSPLRPSAAGGMIRAPNHQHPILFSPI
jgi:hypothetical protein